MARPPCLPATSHPGRAASPPASSLRPPSQRELAFELSALHHAPVVLAEGGCDARGARARGGGCGGGGIGGRWNRQPLLK